MDFNKFKELSQKKEVQHFQHQVSSKPLVSVLVQTYKHEVYIKQCLDTILTQKTNFDFEILLGEDASKDNTRAICIDYAKRHPEKIRLFLHHPANKIKVLNIITGNFNSFYNLYHARGKYIAFCEGDDYWTDPLKLQKQVDYLENNSEYALVYHKFKEECETQTDLRKTLKQPSKDLSQEELFKLTYHPLLSTVCFRNILKNLPEEIIQVINVDSFLLSLLGSIGKAKFQPEIKSSIYRRHSGGIWTSEQKKIRLKSKYHTYKKIITYNSHKQNWIIVNAFRSKLKNHLKTQILYYYRLRNFKEFWISLLDYFIIKFK